MTEDRIAQAGIPFQETFFTPKGISTAVSKAIAIQEVMDRGYESVAHFDDDPITAAYLAATFPDVTIYLITYPVNGLLYSHAEIQEYPNIHRIGMIGEYGDIA